VPENATVLQSWINDDEDEIFASDLDINETENVILSAPASVDWRQQGAVSSVKD
jgi:hypothetical protein